VSDHNSVGDTRDEFSITGQFQSTDERSINGCLNNAFCCSLNTMLSDESGTSETKTRKPGDCNESSDSDTTNLYSSLYDSVADDLSLDDLTLDDLSLDASSTVSLSSLSTFSSCSEHSVRIEQHRLLISANPCHSLTETQFIPDNKSNIPCSNKSATNSEGEKGCKSLECSYLSDSHLMRSDWQEGPQSPVNSDEQISCLLPEVEKLSSVQLRAKLIEFGESPGPIVASTRRAHELRLCSYMAGYQTSVKEQSGNYIAACR
jgi:LEM domain